MPFLSGFSKRKEIRYGTTIPDSNLTDFPKLIKISSDSNIASELTSGGGIAVTTNDGTTTVPFGLYPSTDLDSGNIILRAKFPTLLAAASTGDILGYIYYNAHATTVEDKAGTVSNNYVLFMPLEEDPSGSAPQIYDWVSESNIGTSNGSMTSGDLVAGQVSQGLDFDGSNDYIDCGSPLTGTGSFTVESIVKNRSSGYKTFVGGKKTSSGDAGSFYLQRRGDTNQWAFDVKNNLGTEFICYGASETQDIFFHSIAGTFDSSTGTIQFFLDGTTSGSPATLTGTRDTCAGILISAGEFGSNIVDFTDSVEDEVRVSSVARSADWIAYSYEDDFSNADTFTLGDEEELRGLAVAKTYAVAAWALDETSGTRYDSVGSNDLTDNNTVGSATGKFGNAADFESDSSEYLSISDNADLSTGDVDFVFRAWVKFESINNFPIIAHKGWTANAGEWVLYCRTNDDNKLWFSVESDANTVKTATVITGVWYHIVVWHDSINNEIGICLNGTTTTASYSGGITNTTGNFELGTISSASFFFDGLIDDVVFLKGYILNSTERTEDYNGGTGIAFADWDRTLADAVSSAVACWTLDETSGTRYDSVGSNDLTDNNTVGSATGKFGNAADFESGNSEYLSVADNATLSTGDIKFCVRAWVNLESKPSRASIAGKISVNDLEWEIGYTGGGTDRFDLRVCSNSNFTLLTTVTAYNGGSPSTGTWYLIHAWHDPDADQIGISVNAGTADTASFSTGLYDSGAEVKIGGYSNYNEYWDGLIDDVVILKNYILTSGQRTLDYNGGTGIAFADWSGAGASFTYDASGKLSLTGLASEVVSVSVDATGGITLTGLSSQVVNFSVTAVGGLNIGLTCVAKQTYLYTASGNLSIGSAASAQGNNQFSYTASGNLIIESSATAQGNNQFSYTASGNLIIESSATAQGNNQFSYTASGNLTVGESGTVRPTYLHVATGNLIVGSTANVLPRYLYTASGNLTVGESGTVRPTYLHVATGNLIVGSTANVLPRYLYTASGNLTVGESGTVKPTYLYTASGNLIIESSATAQGNNQFSYTASGNLIVNESGTVKPTYLYTASGNLIVNESGTVKPTYLYTASGNLIIGSSATVKPTYSYTASGNLTVGSAGTVKPTYVTTASGLVTLGSVATISPTYSYTVSGNLIIGSSATVKPTYSYTASGNLTVGSAGTVIPGYLILPSGSLTVGNTSTPKTTYLYTASGNLIVGESATSQQNDVVHYVSSGSLSLGNTALVTPRYIYTASGNLIVIESAEITTRYLYTTVGKIATDGSGVCTIIFPQSTGGLLATSGLSSYERLLVYVSGGRINLPRISAEIQAIIASSTRRVVNMPLCTNAKYIKVYNNFTVCVPKKKR